MRAIPNFVLMAPKDESELQRMLITSINHKGPTALRIPRGSGLGAVSYTHLTLPTILRV